MDLNLVNTFLIVAEYQSYTQAAQHLGLTQPAVSSAIKRLEEQIGKSLFVKQGRGIALTPSAVQLMGHFRHGIETIENAIDNIERFYVSSAEPLLHNIQSINDVTVIESPSDKYQLFEDLRQQRIDLAIDPMPVKDLSFISEPVYQEDLVVICRNNHPRIQGSISKVEFYSETHCLCSAKWNNLTGVEQLTREPLQERKVDMIVSSNANMMLRVSQSESLAVISSLLAKTWAQVLGFQILPSPLALDPVRYQFIYHRRNLNNPNHQRLRAVLKAKITEL